MSDTAEAVADTPLDVSKVQNVMDRIFDKKEPAQTLAPAEVQVVVKDESVTPVATPERTEPVSDEPPESLPVEGRSEKWKDLRSRYAEMKKEAVSLKAQLAEFEGTKKERDELKARIADSEEKIKKLSDIDSLARWQNDPDVQAKYDIPREATMKELSELAGYSDIDPGELLGVLRLEGKDQILALDRLVSSAPSVLQNKIIAAVDRVKEIEKNRAAELVDVRGSLEKRQEARRLEETTKRTKLQQQAEETFKRTSESLSKELGLDEATIIKAREFFQTNNDLDAAARIVIKGMAADGVLGKGAEQAKRIAELEAELSKYRESSPGVSSGSSGASISREMSFLDAIKNGAKEARLT